jgi:hypothetical protein
VAPPLGCGHIAVVDGNHDLQSAPDAFESQTWPPDGLGALESPAMATQPRGRRPSLEIARPGVVHRSGVGLELIYEIVD